MQVLRTDTDYRVIKDKNTRVLQRLKRDGTGYNDIARLVSTAEDMLLMVDKQKNNSYKFRIKDTTLKLKLVGDVFAISVPKNTQLKVYKRPNHNYYHTEVMQSNRAMLHLSTAKFMQQIPQVRDNLTVDYDTILDNMLEYLIKF